MIYSPICSSINGPKVAPHGSPVSSGFSCQTQKRYTWYSVIFKGEVYQDCF